MSDRRRERRETLILAGVALLGAEGGPAVSVRSVCRSANLTERYFYEAFTDRDDYVVQVFDYVADMARHAMSEAIAPFTGSSNRRMATAIITAFTRVLLDDPAMGRLLLFAPYVEPALSKESRSQLPAFVSVVESRFGEIEDDLERHMRALALVGALTMLYQGYLEGTLTVSREVLEAHMVQQVLDAARSSDS